MPCDGNRGFLPCGPHNLYGRGDIAGQQAINYVRTGKEVGDQLNISRMKRQEDYIKGFLKALQEKVDAPSTHEEISPYIVTDMSTTIFSNILQRYTEYDFSQIISPEGENVLMQKYYEFHLDEKKLDDLILRLFYAPK